MKLSRKCDYALRALVRMAMQQEPGYQNIAAIARQEDIPARYLEQIFLTLKNAGILSSKAGPGGGYRLCKAAGEIPLGRVIRLIDGPVAPVRCVSRTAYEKCPHEATCALRPIMKDVRDAIAGILDSITLEDACKRAEGIMEISPGRVGPA